MRLVPARTDLHPHVAKAERYSADVLSGAIPACKAVRQAMERQIRDLGRQDTPGFPYRFDEAAAERACRFLEQLPHVKGPFANRGELWRMEPHQCWFYTTLFGWRNARSGHRRFNRAYREIPRGTGKSFEAAGVGNYCAFADGEQGAEVYSAATTRDQAKLVWQPARMMLKKRSELADAISVQVNANDLYQPATGSVFRPLSSDHDTLDGLNIYCAVIDELHAHPTRGLYDVLETAISKRDQALLLIITTAGSDRTGICYELRTDLLRVLDGSAEDESYLGIVYTIDEGDDWRSEESWRKANPNWGVSVNPEFIRTLARKAERIPAAQAAFKTKHLNVWVNANNALYDLERWVKLGDSSLREEDFKDEQCITGLDLASKDDLMERVKLFWRLGDDEKWHLYAFGRHYIHREAIEDGRNDRYPGWAEEGWLTVNEGNTTDQAVVEEEIRAEADKFQHEAIGFDPWNAGYISQRLAESGAPMVELRPTVANFSEATKYLGVLINEGRIHHNGDPVASWQVGNVVGHYDAKDNVFPRKEKPDQKIDYAVALIMALSLWLRREDIYTLNDALEEEGLLVL